MFIKWKWLPYVFCWLLFFSLGLIHPEGKLTRELEGGNFSSRVVLSPFVKNIDFIEYLLQGCLIDKYNDKALRKLKVNMQSTASIEYVV